MSSKRSQVPGAKEWAGYEADHDIRYARKLLGGKSISEAVGYFASGRSIERGHELRHMPRAAFQYYVFAFVAYLHSAEAVGDADAASVFLRLLLDREERDPGSVRSIYPELRQCVRFASGGQEYFEASPDIYGSFSELGRKIDDACASE